MHDSYADSNYGYITRIRPGTSLGIVLLITCKISIRTATLSYLLLLEVRLEMVLQSSPSRSSNSSVK